MDTNLTIIQPQLDAYDMQVKQIGQWGLVWRRLKRHKLAVIGAWILLGLVILAIVGPSIAPSDTNNGSGFIQQYNRGQPPQLWPLSLDRIFGTDTYTNPVSGYVLNGARPPLIIGFLGGLIASVIGVIIGSIAGYFGRFVDTVLMRLTDAFLTVPLYPLIALLGTYYVTGASDQTYALLFGIVGWAGVARLVRSYILSFQQREFAEAARAMEASDLGIMFRHLVPNVLDIIIVSYTLNVSIILLTAANLGRAGPWVRGISYESPNWWEVVIPGFFLLMMIISVNFLGDGLRDAFDTTSTDALIDWQEKPQRAWQRILGRLIRRVWDVVAPPLGVAWNAAMALRPRGEHDLGWTVAGSQIGVSTVRREPRIPIPAPLRRAVAPLGVVAAPLNRLVPRIERLPVALRLVPPVLAILCSMVVFLVGHSPLRYAEHFTAVQPLVTAEEQSEYGAHPLPHGGWSLLYLDPSGGISYATVSGTGRLERHQQVARTGTEPSLASHHGWTLGVWLNGDTSTVKAAFVGNHRSRPFSLVPGYGLVDHPYVTAAPGGFDVLFQWQKTSTQAAEFQIYLAYVRNGQTRPAVLRLIGATPVYGFYPHGVIDGSGKLDVLYLDEWSKPNNWYWRFQRFTPQGIPVSPKETIDDMCFGCQDPQDSIVPTQWEVDMKRASDGSVWAVLEGGGDGGDGANLAHWSPTGRVLLPVAPVPIGFDSGQTSALSLALLHQGGQLFYTSSNPDGGVGSVTFMQAFDDNGALVGSPQRVNYDSGGNSAIPHAGTVSGRPVVIWQRIREGPAYLEASSYHANASKPDWQDRLGLNVGNFWLNSGLVVVGSLAGGVAVAIINFILLLLLVLLWLPIGWLAPRSIRWLVCAIASGLVIVELFGIHAADLPSWVLVISGLGSPENWVAVAVAIFASVWAGLFLFRRYEAIFRAAAMAYTSVYVIAVMYAVIFIQSELTRI